MLRPVITYVVILVVHISLIVIESGPNPAADLRARLPFEQVAIHPIIIERREIGRPARGQRATRHEERIHRRHLVNQAQTGIKETLVLHGRDHTGERVDLLPRQLAAQHLPLRQVLEDINRLPGVLHPLDTALAHPQGNGKFQNLQGMITRLLRAIAKILGAFSQERGLAARLEEQSLIIVAIKTTAVRIIKPHVIITRLSLLLVLRVLSGKRDTRLLRTTEGTGVTVAIERHVEVTHD